MTPVDRIEKVRMTGGETWENWDYLNGGGFTTRADIRIMDTADVMI